MGQARYRNLGNEFLNGLLVESVVEVDSSLAGVVDSKPVAAAVEEAVDSKPVAAAVEEAVDSSPAVAVVPVVDSSLVVADLVAERVVVQAVIVVQVVYEQVRPDEEATEFSRQQGMK
jgi:hypothetical protein